MQAIAYRIAAILVTAVGSIVMFGWIVGWTAVTQVNSNWVSMKFSAALCFAMSGAMMMLRKGTTMRKQVARTALGFGTVIVMSEHLFAATTGDQSLFADMFGMGDNSPGTIRPGQPSHMVMVAFLLLAFAGLLSQRAKVWIRSLGAIVCAIGLFALGGYLIHEPLFFYSTDQSTAMSAHSSALFAIAGAAVLLGPNGDTPEAVP